MIIPVSERPMKQRPKILEVHVLSILLLLGISGVFAELFSHLS
jgi:hypothetical protein